MLRSFAFIFGLMVLVLSVGCAAPRSIETPAARVIAARVVDESAQGGRVEVIVQLENPNASPLPLLEVDYQVTVEGVGRFAATDEPNRTLPGLGHGGEGGPGLQLVYLYAAFETDGRSLKGRAYQCSGRVTYEPPGEMRKLLTESAVPLPTTSFSGSGALE